MLARCGALRGTRRGIPWQPRFETRPSCHVGPRVRVHAGGLDLDALIDVPEIHDGLRSFQEKLGGVFDDNDVAVSFGEDNDWKSAEAWEYGVVLVDRSHWGRLRFAGEDRLDFLHSQSTQALTDLQPGQSLPTVFVTSTARTIDTALVLAQGQGALAIVSPGMADTLQQRLQKHIFPMDKVQLKNITEQTKMFTVLGPHAGALVAEWGGPDLENLSENCHTLLAFNKTPVIVVKTSGLGSHVPGWTFILDEAAASEFWRKAALKGVLPMGADIWEHVRVRNGVPQAGAELTDAVNPLEAGLYDAVSLAKGCYIGQETLAKVHNNNGVKQQLWGLRLRAGCTCAPGDAVLSSEGGRRLGHVTSCTERGGQTFALAYLKCKEGGEQVALEGRSVLIGDVPAKVTAVPALTREFRPGAVKVSGKGSGVVSTGEAEAAAAAKGAKLAAMQARLAAWQQQQAQEK